MAVCDRGARMLALLAASLVMTGAAAAEELDLRLRYQQETSDESGRFHRLTRGETWRADETAVIVCDVWDLHHCLNAVRRLEEFAPRLNEVLIEARRRGATVIHAPSDCMPAYEEHPARRRAVDVPVARSLPEGIEAWCSRIPAEERAVYPIDQSDGGEDDDPQEHARWAAKLKSLGRNPAMPWKRQSDLIDIDDRRDYISDRGDEVWNILKHRGIKNVILTGVHVNMCVLGRPFGLRQMVRNGVHVVLMRDMTDAMYNPGRWPYVSHFTGNDLVIAHIERYVCPTVTSDQLLGGRPFRFANDTRPHLAIVMAEDEYETDRTLPDFAVRHLGHAFRVSLVFGSDQRRHDIPGLEVLDDADLLLVSVRRRALPASQMRHVRRFVEAGRPVVGMRTASHAFAVRASSIPEGCEVWPEFDAQVFGGNYHGHHGNRLRSTVRVVGEGEHPIVRGLPGEPFAQAGSLYQTSPLAAGTRELLRGRIEGAPAEPVAWTFERADGGRSFYTSMGHPGDLENPAFTRMLVQALHWAADRAPASSPSVVPRDHWIRTVVPDSSPNEGPVWYRAVVRLPAQWTAPLRITSVAGVQIWVNGHEVESGKPLPAKCLIPQDANLIVLRTTGGLRQAPALECPDWKRELAGAWQSRAGDDARWSNMPLPARFGAATDILFYVTP